MRQLPHIWLLALSVRLLNALISRTFFQPDEYWQSLEVAHRLAFEYGYETWEWRALGGHGGIRSALYPALFVPVYWALEKARLDQTALLVVAPKLVQACIAAWCDVSTYHLATRLFGRRYGNAALFCSLVSFFNFYAATRTFSNSTETALTTAALALWPWDGFEYSRTPSEANEDKTEMDAPTSLTGALALAAIATILRPSNVVIWLVLGSSLLYHARSRVVRVQILQRVFLVAALAIPACACLDTAFYGIPTFTPYTFLLQNVVHSVSLFYGANASHFYVTQAVPFMTLSMLPFVLHGLVIAGRGNKKARAARSVVGWTVGAYSLLAHKEFRFIHPLLPVLHTFAAYSLVTLYSFSRPSPSPSSSP